MITADKCVKEICEYLKLSLMAEDLHMMVNVYEYEDKPKTYKGVYIAVNSLPFVFGYALNDKCILNVNLHIPSMSDGSYYRKNGDLWTEWLLSRLPVSTGTENEKVLQLKHASYIVTDISQPRKDIDNTHYINFHLKVLFPNI